MLAETMDQTTCGPSDTDTQGFESTPECFDTVKRDFAYPPTHQPLQDHSA
jgi:hypothetical protein